MKKIVAINASPRKGWNTDIIVTEAAKGAESTGAHIEKRDLYKMEKFTGCISCFGCKREKNLGRCIYKDGLAPVLEGIRMLFFRLKEHSICRLFFSKRSSV